MSNKIVTVGNRVPRQFFRTAGKGESDITVHAGSYHLALREAGIEMCNIVTYSSILPATAEEVPHTRSNHHTIRQLLLHGSVMECILAEASGQRGEMVTAGLIYGWLQKPDGTRHGGLVCEYNGNLPEELAYIELGKMINELYTNGYEHFELVDQKAFVTSFIPEKQYGTAVVALCFLNYDVPILATEEN